ncbi:MAG: hypothetical protein J6K39_01075 [Clostridia bacterium]|nr:hypothetical protein [Clostridia bacterium]
MKKKFSLLLLSVLLVPLFALFGCEDVVSYPVTIASSSISHGSVQGNGTYAEGSTVTLTANAKSGHFIAWVHQNATEVEANNTYTIVNTTGSDEKVTKSVLTFTMSAETQGLYTAVFSEGKVWYVKYDGMYLTTNPDSEPVEENNQETLMTANLSISQGSTNMPVVYTVENMDIKQNVLIAPEKMLSVLKLQTTQHIHANTHFLINDQSITINFRADISFQTSTDFVSGNNYSYKVDYADGTYKVIFKFNVGQQPAYLVLRYKSL